jgi:hypothetical protein
MLNIRQQYRFVPLMHQIACAHRGTCDVQAAFRSVPPLAERPTIQTISKLLFLVSLSLVSSAVT